MTNYFEISKAKSEAAENALENSTSLHDYSEYESWCLTTHSKIEMLLEQCLDTLDLEGYTAGRFADKIRAELSKLVGERNE